jgi:hypothetical protein
MKAHKGWENTRKAQKDAIADFMILMAVASCHTLKPYRSFSKPVDKTLFTDDFTHLLRWGCTPKALVTALQMSNTIDVENSPPSRQVKPMAKRIRGLAHELGELESSGRLVWRNYPNPVNPARQNGDPPDAWRLTKGLYTQAEKLERSLRKAGRKASPSLDARLETVIKNMRELAGEMVDLEGTGFLAIQNRRRPLEQEAGKTLRERLYNRADDYEDWLRMASEKVPPRSHSLMRVNHVCPVLYVKWATRGHPFHERVANLLSIVKTQITAPQLAREVEEFETSYPWSSDYIRSSLARVHRGEKIYRVLPVKPYRRSEL